MSVLIPFHHLHHGFPNPEVPDSLAAMFHATCLQTCLFIVMIYRSSSGPSCNYLTGVVEDLQSARHHPVPPPTRQLSQESPESAESADLNVPIEVPPDQPQPSSNLSEMSLESTSSKLPHKKPYDVKSTGQSFNELCCPFAAWTVSHPRTYRKKH